MQDILFTAIDPLNNEIKFLKETFAKHIIIRHPEMRGKIKDIKSTIEKPLYIGLGTKDKRSMVYLGKFFGHKMPYIVVAVRRIKRFNKIILTAFGTKNLGLNKINKILWQTENHHRHSGIPRRREKNFIIPTPRPRKR